MIFKPDFFNEMSVLSSIEIASITPSFGRHHTIPSEVPKLLRGFGPLQRRVLNTAGSHPIRLRLHRRNPDVSPNLERPRSPHQGNAVSFACITLLDLRLAVAKIGNPEGAEIRFQPAWLRNPQLSDQLSPAAPFQTGVSPRWQFRRD